MNFAMKWNVGCARLASGLCLALLMSVTGCASLAARWVGTDLRPEMARDQFRFLQADSRTGKFVKTDIRLQQDGTYTAETNYDGQLEQSSGTWKYDEKGFLNFTDKQGNAYGYGLRKVDDNTIEVIKGVKGTDVTLTLKRQ